MKALSQSGFGQRRCQGNGEPAGHDARALSIWAAARSLPPGWPGRGTPPARSTSLPRAGPPPDRRRRRRHRSRAPAPAVVATWRRGDGADVPRTAAATPSRRSMRPTRSSRRPRTPFPGCGGWRGGLPPRGRVPPRASAGRWSLAIGSSTSASRCACGSPRLRKRRACSTTERRIPREEEPRVELDPREQQDRHRRRGRSPHDPCVLLLEHGGRASGPAVFGATRPVPLGRLHHQCPLSNIAC